jgi:poly(hydroxyalkanoate) depolymerase family esterase
MSGPVPTFARPLGVVAIVALAGCAGRPASPLDAAVLDGSVLDAGGFAHDAERPAPDAPGGVGVWVDGTYSDGQGQRDYRVYVPSGYVAGVPAPLVTVLHGCSLDAAQMDATTRYSALAEARTFLVVYPEQSPAANPGLCWSWFDPANQARGGGEGALIAGITRAVIQRWSIDQRRVFVIGGSAGGAMSVLLGATYPDLFAAVGVVAGCEFGGAPCGPTGGPDPTTQGRRAWQAMGPYARPQPIVVFQGDADVVVAPVNGRQLIAQWLATDDYADDGALDGSVSTSSASTANGQVPGGRGFVLQSFADRSGATLLESYVVQGAGHAWPGGPASAAFGDPGGPDATRLSYQFFVAHPAP